MVVSSSVVEEQLTLEWKYLPEHILDIILNKLVSLVDYLSFISSVCKRWHSVACHLPNKNPRMMITTTPQALPLLLRPSQHDNVKQLFNFIKNKVYDFKHNLPPNFTNTRVSGSSHGWLIFVEKGLIVTLFNPFSSKIICLPAVPLDYIEENHDDERDYQFWINEVVLSRDPLFSPNIFEVAIVFSDMFRLGLYQSSKNSWTYDLTDHLQYPNYDDVIYYNDKFYVVDNHTGLATINYDSTDPARLDTVVERKSPLDDMFSLCIVSTTNGDLLLIRRILDLISSDDTETWTVDFEIYKLKYILQKEKMMSSIKKHIGLRLIASALMLCSWVIIIPCLFPLSIFLHASQLIIL